MPRPRIQRHVCCLPRIDEFRPIRGHWSADEVVVLAVDEYEAIRLIDLEGLSQEQCSDNMNIARTTAQQIYGSARKKIARALVEGLPIKIEGGDYLICSGSEHYCGRGQCRRQRGGPLRAMEQEETK